MVGDDGVGGSSGCDGEKGEGLVGLAEIGEGVSLVPYADCAADGIEYLGCALV